MVSALEYLALLRDRADDGFEGRSAIGVAERAGLDLGHDSGYPAADRAEVLEAFFPQEPRVAGAAVVLAPAGDQFPSQIVIHSAVLANVYY